MHLIAPLVGGIAGAGNGYAVIRRRGTSTAATCYSDFVGTVVSQPSAGFSLDANGGYVVYVNELVDVTVQTSDGTTLRTFVAGDAAPNVEVQSTSFTGTDYTSGASATGKPTTLQTVLDAWKTSAGEPDFNVLFGGASATIQNALGALYGVFINVKSPAYGALGDGATDDTTPIQNALTAATTPHSIVFFPYGTYRITTKLTVPVGVSLWGVGAEGSAIKIDHATSDTLEYGSGTSVSYQEIRGLAIEAAQSNSGKPISVTNAGARNILLVNSVINKLLLFTGDVVTLVGGTHSFVASLSAIYVAGVTKYGIKSNTDSAVTILATSITCATNLYTGSLVWASILTCSDSSFSSTGTSAGAGTSNCVRIYNGTNQWVRITGCFFYTTTSGPIAITADGSNTAAAFITEENNIYSGFTTIWSGLVAGSNRPEICLGGRDRRIQNLTDNSATVNISGGAYGTVFLTRTTAGAAQTITDTVGAPEGAYLTVLVYNNSGGALAGAVNFNGSGFLTTSATVNPANGKTSIYNFRMVVSGGNGVWVPTGTAITTT